MNWYLVLLKFDPNHTEDVVQQLQKFPKNPTPNVNLYYSYYVFGTWDACLWFYCNNHDDAMNFVQKFIRPIRYVTETFTMPTTTIKQYK